MVKPPLDGDNRRASLESIESIQSFGSVDLVDITEDEEDPVDTKKRPALSEDDSSATEDDVIDADVVEKRRVKRARRRSNSVGCNSDNNANRKPPGIQRSSSDLGRAGPSQSKEAKAAAKVAKQRQREEARVLRQQEKEQMKLSREQQREEIAARTGKFALREIKIVMDQATPSALVDAVRSVFNKENVRMACRELPCVASITWVRVHRNAPDGGNDPIAGGSASPTEDNYWVEGEKPEDLWVLRMSGREIIDRHSNGTLQSFVKQAVDALPSKGRLLVISERLYGLVSSEIAQYMSKKKRVGKGQLVEKPSFPNLPALERKLASIWFRLGGRVTFKAVEDMAELATFLMTMTKCLARGPYKVTPNPLTLVKPARTMSMKGADLEGERRFASLWESWVSSLIQIKGMSDTKAQAVANRWTSFASLQVAYDTCSDATERSRLLQDIKLANGRRLGPALSLRICQQLYTAHFLPDDASAV